MDELLWGLFTGVVFGVLLQKGGVSKFPVIIGQFLLRDGTVARILLTAIAVGSMGVYAIVYAGSQPLQIKPAAVGAVVLGGILFGAGIAVLGYCPGTTVAACGEGRRDAMAGLAGMLTGAVAYVLLSGLVQGFVQRFPDFGKVTLPQATQTSPWLWVLGLLSLAAWGIYLVDLRRGARAG